MRRKVGALVALLFLAFTIDADSRIWYVTESGAGDGTSWASSASLSAALAEAAASDELWLAQGSYTSDSSFTVGEGLLLFGGFDTDMVQFSERDWNAHPVLLDGQAANRRVVTVSGGDVLLDGVTIQNSGGGSSAGGLIKSASGDLVLANCRIENHTGISINMQGLGAKFTAGKVLMTNCVVANNTMTGSSAYRANGFGVFSSGADLELVDCLFTNHYGDTWNTRESKGVALFFDKGKLAATRTHFIGNSGGVCHTLTSGGAAAYLGSSAGLSAVFSNCVFRDNIVNDTASYNMGGGYGGAVFASLAANGSVTISHCLFENNAHSNAWGGALAVANGTALISSCDFIGNRAGKNNASRGGGAIYLGSSLSVVISNCTFLGNTAIESGGATAGWGAAVFAELLANRTATVVNCTFSGNFNDHENGKGGAVAVNGGTLMLENSILWSNSVRGGRVGNELFCGSGRMLLDHCCLSGLSAPYVYGVSPEDMTCVMTNDPLFASETDLHLQSPAGRWDPAEGDFVTTDTAYSPCIDAGRPEQGPGDEPEPNGGRVNLGAEGGTAQASKSPSAAPQIVARGYWLDWTRAAVSSELVNAEACIADVGLCVGRTNIPDDTTNGWEQVWMLYPPQQPGQVFSVSSPYPHLMTDTLYYYRWFAVNAQGESWTAAATFNTGSEQEPGQGLGGGLGVIHVKQDATGSNNGRDWLNAYTTIADGYSAANEERNSIWISGGTYVEGYELMIDESVAIAGAFQGNETDIDQRDLSSVQTVIDGDGCNWPLVSVLAPDVVLDALVISNTFGNGAVGLIKSASGDLMLANCRIENHTGNAVGMQGLGAKFTAGKVLMTNCVVANNTISGANAYNGSGFGVYSSGADLKLVDCTFSNNYGNATNTRTTKGIALSFNGGELNVLRTSFVDNEGGANNGGGGGAVYIGQNAANSVSFEKCEFRNNAALNYIGRDASGGALWLDLATGKEASFENCTFAHNRIETPIGTGGAISINRGLLKLKNCIFWDNAAQVAIQSKEIFGGNSASMQASFSCFTGTDEPYITITGGTPDWQEGVITGDPLFASASDLHLSSKGGRWDPISSSWIKDEVTSPCIDAGDPLDPFDEEPSPNGKRINMGAFGGTGQASKSDQAKVSVVFYFR